MMWGVLSCCFPSFFVNFFVARCPTPHTTHNTHHTTHDTQHTTHNTQHTPHTTHHTHGGDAADSRKPFAAGVSMTGGSGSLDVDSRQMPLPHKYGRLYNFWTEEKRLPKRLQNEGRVNESIVVKRSPIVVSLGSRARRATDSVTGQRTT